jgi:transposase InsO family protein
VIDQVHHHSQEMALGLTMTMICQWYDISRQAHYQQKQRDQQRQEEEAQILDIVRQWRRHHPRMGVRKVLTALQDEFKAQNLSIGRDRLFDLLREHNLLVKLLRRPGRTTWPGHWRSENLLPEATITAPNQAWVSDITYIHTEEGFVYLSLITDVFSRRILGYDLSNTLAVEGSLRALQMALKEAGPLDPGLIFHSDHGIQYTCSAFREALRPHRIRSSMGQVGNCYDNAIAERLNGILKQEYGLGDIFVDQSQVQLAVDQAVFLYNHQRPHFSLNLLTPDQVYFDYYSINLMSTNIPLPL